MKTNNVIAAIYEKRLLTGGYIPASSTIDCTDADNMNWSVYPERMAERKAAFDAMQLKRQYERAFAPKAAGAIKLSADEIARRLMDMLEREGAVHLSSLVRELELCGVVTGKDASP